ALEYRFYWHLSLCSLRRPYPHDSCRAPHINDIFHRAREIGNKSVGSGYRLRGVRSYSGVERNGSEGDENAEAQTWQKQLGSLSPRVGLHGTEFWLRSRN